MIDPSIDVVSEIIALAADDAAHGRGEPPADIVAPVKGLPPGRARLARYLAWRKVVAAEVGQLEAGRAKLADQIDRADRARAECASEAKAGARAILDKIRKGLDWTIPGAVSAKHQSAAQALAASAPDLEVARAALAQVDGEIEAKKTTLATLEGRHAEFVNAALREEARRIGEEYRAAIDAMIEAATQLEALDRLCGAGHDGRVVGELPGFAMADHRFAAIPVALNSNEISAALGVWREQARAWSKDPRVAADLRFVPHDPIAEDSVSYEQLTRVERSIVDAGNVNQGA